MNEIAVSKPNPRGIFRRASLAPSLLTRYRRKVIGTVTDVTEEAAEILRDTFGSLISEAFHFDRSEAARLYRDLRRDVGVE